MRQISGVRKADKAHGDDTTLTRFVKLTPEEGGRATRQHARQARLPGMESAFIREGRTKFTGRVLPVAAMPKILVSAYSNVKVGRDVRKGFLRGYWIYLLSLEERKTCPSSCLHWQSCYGNSMPFAKRVKHDDPDFLPRLASEVAELYEKHDGRVLIRLHQLGDFFSPEYVIFWRDILDKFPMLAVYGYTARDPLSVIGNKIQQLNLQFADRCFVRFSNGGLPTMSTVSIGSPEACPPNAFVCPEQTGKTRCCATCGACWGTEKNVAFVEH